jgi:hypothetical protein
MAAVTAELGALVTEPMPADLAARLDASFASSIASPTTIDPVLARSTEPRLVPSSDRHLVSVPGTGVDRPAQKRKRLRWATPIAVAAGVLAFAGFSADYLAGRSGSSDGAQSSAAGSAENAAPMIGTDSGATSGLVGFPPADKITRSGTDYRDNQLTDRSSAAAKGPEQDAGSGSAAPLRAAGNGRAELQRLDVRAALAACLEAIARENGKGPISVQAVDYARYQGVPALVVQFVATSDGKALTWAVGADCGLDGGGADRL